MPAVHSVDKNAKLLITKWKGDAVDIELIEAITAYQESIQMNPEYIDFNEIVDFSQVESIKLTPEETMRTGKIATKTDIHKAQSKLALIVTSGVAFNLARMYTTYRNMGKSATKEIRIFKYTHEALEWVQGEA